MLVKRYIQQLTDLFDGDEKLIYGQTFIISQQQFPLSTISCRDFRGFFFPFKGVGVHKFLCFYESFSTMTKI